jgi:transcription antitermination factor NusG
VTKGAVACPRHFCQGANHIGLGGALDAVVNDLGRNEELHPWFGIRTKSNRERVSAVSLEGKGYTTYFPTYSARRRWSDRAVESERPLFPGYVFCRFDPQKRLPILTTPGVVAVVGFGSVPAPIPDPEIEAVERVLRSGIAAEPCPFLRQGQRVRINYGSLQGLEGILVKKKSNWRLIVSVVNVARSISVEIDADWVTTA